MNLLIYGDDTALVAARVRELKNHFVKGNADSEITTIDVADLPEPEQILDMLTTVPLWGGKRCFILSGFLTFSWKGEYASVWDWIDSIGQENVLFFVEYQNDVPTKVKRVVQWIADEQLTKKLMFACPKGNAIKTNIKLTTAQQNYLNQVYSQDPLMAYQELHKASLLTDANRPDLIDEVFNQPEFSTSIFRLTDTVFARNARGAAEAIQDLLGQGENEHMLLSMLINHLKKILFILDAESKAVPSQEVLKKLKVHPFVAKNMMKQKSLFSLGHVQGWLQTLLEIDLQSKQGKVDAKVALTQFCVSIV